jgi:hypothetical protein
MAYYAVTVLVAGGFLTAISIEKVFNSPSELSLLNEVIIPSPE